jgi:hypothetical protein
MIIQSNPAMFVAHLPVYSVTAIDRVTGVVTLSGSDGTSLNVPLNLWGDVVAAQPLVGSQVQLLE